MKEIRSKQCKIRKRVIVRDESVLILMNRLFSSFRKPIVVSLLTSAFVQPISYSDSSTSSNNPTRTFKKDFVPNRLTFKAIEDDNDMVTVISRTAGKTLVH